MILEITLTGETPLLLHNEQLANQMNPYARRLKELTSLQTKTDETYYEMAQVEFYGGLYFDKKLGPFVPAASIKKCGFEAAKFTKDGKKFLGAFSVEGHIIPLQYLDPDGRPGPREMKALWTRGEENGMYYQDQRMVKVGMMRILRTRPKFERWSLKFTGRLDTGLLSLKSFADILRKAGEACGLGDGRTLGFGRFKAKVTEVKFQLK